MKQGSSALLAVTPLRFDVLTHLKKRCLTAHGINMELREYQKQLLNKINQSHLTNQNVLAVLPTGGGKTVIISHLLKQVVGYSCVIAHRQEIVSQISLALAKNNKHHAIIAPTSVIRTCVKIQMQELGCSYYDADSKCYVAGVDTIIRRNFDWYGRVKLWVVDEAHHVVKGNKWHQATELFKNAKGLGVTATPVRADKKGLGRNASGIIDEMVIGVQMRELILNGFLSKYRVFAPSSNIDNKLLKIGTTGDYSKASMVKAIDKAKITGDIVEHYNKLAKGLKAVVFAINVNHSIEIAEAFNKSGIKAASISAKTPDKERYSLLRQFKDGKITILTNCDLFGEGFDLPSVSCVIFCRMTASYGLYSQMFGRSLRPAPGKEYAIIIDHVGNCLKHGFPDQFIEWSLDDGVKTKKKEVDKYTTCVECTGVYDRMYPNCPYCGHYKLPPKERTIEQVAGELEEILPNQREQIFKDIEKAMMSVEEYDKILKRKKLYDIARVSVLKKHLERQKELNKLKEEILKYTNGYEDKAWMQRHFYLTFGIDILSACALKRKEAKQLRLQINERRTKNLSRMQT